MTRTHANDVVRASVVRPFVIAGLFALVFLQYNDALREFFGPLPVLDLIAVLTAVLIILTLAPNEVSRRFEEAWPIFVTLAALLLIVAFSRVYAIDPAKAADDLNRKIKVAAMVLILAYGVRSVRDLGIVVHAFIVASIVLGAFLVAESIHGSPLLDVARHSEQLDTFNGVFRSSGLSMSSPPMAASLCLCGAVLSAVMGLRAGSKRVFYALGFAVPTVAIFLSLTRSATICIFLVLVLLVWRLRRHRNFGLIVLSGLVLVSIALALAPADVWEKMRATFNVSQDQTVLRRISYQVIGWDLFVQNPLVGVGSGNFNAHYAADEYRFVPGRGAEPRPLHNLYLQYLTELGFVGFAVFVGLAGAIVRILGRAAKKATSPDLRVLADALLMAFVCMLFQLLFISSNFLFPYWAIAGLAVAVAYLSRAPKRAELDETLLKQYS